jgi:mRNA-degrading endonuclease RelE of RelBE toxin-antitoxin system
MLENPFSGDVRPIKGGEFRGAYRRQVGRFRILFSVDFVNRAIDVAEILARSESKYD